MSRISFATCFIPRFTLVIFLFLRSRVDGTESSLDVDYLADFILGKDRSDNNLSPLNGTTRVVVEGFLDRLKCVQQGLTHLQCSQCLRPEDVTTLISPTNETETSNLTDIERLSVVLLNHALTFRSTCGLKKDGKFPGCSSYLECRNQLKKRLPMNAVATEEPAPLLEEVENVLREIKGVYEPRQSQKCFSGESLLSQLVEITSGKPNLEQLSTQLIGHLLKGECIDVGEAVTDFLEDLFLHYGDRCSRVITQPGFLKLLNDLKTQRQDEHEDHGTPESSCADILSKSSDGTILKIAPGPTLGTEYEVSGIESSSRDRYPYIPKEVSRRITRGTLQASEEHEHKSLASECLSAEGLLRKFAFSGDPITMNQFLQICPALIQQVVTGVCNDGVNSTAMAMNTVEPSSLEIYGYSSLAVLVISMTSLVGVSLIPVLKKGNYRCSMIGFLGVSFGTMTGDAVLHLIPQAIGVHSHSRVESDSDDHHVAVSLDTIPEYIWVQMGVLIAIFAMFVFQSISERSHGSDESEESEDKSMSVAIPEPTIPLQRVRSESSYTITRNETTSIDSAAVGEVSVKDTALKPHEVILPSRQLFFGFSTVAISIIIADLFHNYGDGVAIGAAFAPGIRGGFSTSLAVFCHELPHEMGDFIVLVSTGLSYKKAILANFFSAMVCFLGLYTGLLIGGNILARKWIMSATAGLFLYVALGEMLPELKENEKGKFGKLFVTKSIGILFGFAIMLIISIFEDHIHL